MRLLDRFKSGLQKTHARIVHEVRRIVTRSPKLTATDLDDLEAALIGADLGLDLSRQIVDAVKLSYESQGRSGTNLLAVAARQVEKNLPPTPPPLQRAPGGLTVVSIVGVNGAGKTTTAAKLAHRAQREGGTPMLAACDTFRAAAIEQLNAWGERLDVPVIAGPYGADPASIAHDAVAAALARGADFLFIDTAGRLHTKSNLMQELQKVHRVIGKKLAGAPHETLLALDAATGMNALSQAREFHKAVPLTGLVVTKLDGTSKGGMVLAIQQELGVPVKFIGLGERVDDLQPFDPAQFAQALFEED